MQRYLRYALLVIGLGALVFLIFFTPVRSWITVENIRGFVDQFCIFAPLAYSLLYFIVVLALLPATVFSVVAGTLFGLFWGWVIVVTTATIAAAVAFLIGRYFGKDIAQKLARSDRVGHWVQKLEDQVEHHGFQTFFIMRSLFVPYIIFSYAAGVVKTAKLRDFILATLLTNAINSFVFVFLGDSIGKGPLVIFVAVILIALALSVPKVLNRFSSKAKALK